MNLAVQDKTVIVTGASSPDGIGFAIARGFAAAGARVAMMDVRQGGAQRLAAMIGGAARGYTCDAADRAACDALAADVLGAWGRIDILVNNAGITQPRKVTEIDAADYDLVMDNNLRGTLHMSQAVIPAMVARGAGSIICIASVAAQRGGGYVGGAHYAASKGGVLGLVKGMARELGPGGVRVNAVNPGVIITDMNRDAFDEAGKRRIADSIPLGRFGRPEDVVGACLFLGSDLSAYVTGAAIDVNGGIHIH
ncbi:MAG: SDR family NAD(P)-dependent oxidoreductase [Gemmobacter sp.]